MAHYLSFIRKISQDDISIDMDSRKKTIYFHRLNKRFTLTFPKCYLDQYTPEGQKLQWLKCWVHNNRGEDINQTAKNVNKLSQVWVHSS